jgi:putative DNA primase/helicase
MTTSTPAQPALVPPATSKRQADTTHTYLRDMWLAHYPTGEIAYTMGEWRRYSGGIWPAIPEWQIKNEIQAIIETEAHNGNIRAQLSRALLGSVLELARVKDPDLIVFKNSALRISTRTEEQHTPVHYATTRLEFDYEPDALCPTWLDLLNHLDPCVTPFLQEFAGYSLTMQTKYELAIWLHGPAGGGKSTFLEGLTSMLGRRAGVLDLPDLERSTFALTNLIGKTLVISAEQPTDYMRSTSVINRIISGEPITVDLKYRDPIVITPRAKVAWAMNDMPRIKEAGSGLFRRVKVIEFPELPPTERDPEIKTIKIPSEAAGIFNWALVGLERLNKRNRFDVPAVITQASDEFRLSNDVPALFIAEMCTRDANREVQSAQLYQTYKQWCYDNGHNPQSSTSIAREWQRLGLIHARQSGTGAKMWRGLFLNP